MSIERSLVVIKPDGVQRGLIGELISRFEKRGLKIVGTKMLWVDRDFAEKHYPAALIPILGGKSLENFKEFGIDTDKTREELGRTAWEDLLKFTTESPVLAIVFEGVHAIKVIRQMVGPTSPHIAPAGTIRGDYAHLSMGHCTVERMGGRNLIHASGDKEDAEKEIALWFGVNELFNYNRADQKHVSKE